MTGSRLQWARACGGAALLAVVAAGCGTTGTQGADAFTTSVVAPAPTPGQTWFFPATNWERFTVGGRGGAIVKVTNLNGSGPGSLRAAVEGQGPRIVVFEVGGVIDLDKQTLVIANPKITVAGQTAPSPGITLIRGGVDIKADDVILQHIRVRPGDAGEAKQSGWEEDAVSTVGGSNIIVDHCSLTWGTDENLSASGPRFNGQTPDQWRAGTSHNILFSHNLIAEGLSYSTHRKVEHSKGSLIHDNVSDIAIYANLYAHNYERSPLFKGGVRGAIVNNFIFDPGQRAIHYNLQGLEWGAKPFETGRMAVVGNVMRAGQSTVADLPLVTIGGDGDLNLFERDNIAVDRFGKPEPTTGRYATGAAKIIAVGRTPELDLTPAPMAAAAVERFVLANAGARPWDRDAHDVRVLADVAEGRGKIIDSQNEVGGYPKEGPTRRTFDPALWDLSTMLPKSPAVLDAGAKAHGT